MTRKPAKPATGATREFAKGTKVETERTVKEVEKLIRQYGGEKFSQGWDGQREWVAFQMEGKIIRFVVHVPAPSEDKYRLKQNGSRPATKRSMEEALGLVEQEVMRRWRALALLLKAKLVGIAEGDRTVMQEFGMDMVIPIRDPETGQYTEATMHEYIAEQIEDAYRGGPPPSLTPGESQKYLRG